MADGRICDNCRQASPCADSWLRLLDPGQQRTDLSSPMAMFLAGDRPRTQDFCTWRCLSEYALLHALDPAPEKTEP